RYLPCSPHRHRASPVPTGRHAVPLESSTDSPLPKVSPTSATAGSGRQKPPRPALQDGRAGAFRSSSRLAERCGIAPSGACSERLFVRGKGAAAKKLKYTGLTRGKAAGVRAEG